MAFTMKVVGSDGALKQFVHRDISPEKSEEDKVYADILSSVGPYTMTVGNGASATYNLFQSVKYIAQNKIEGAVVECGVWKGGSMMLVAKALQYFKDSARSLYLYDTFEGMTEPGEVDIDFDGRNWKQAWQVARGKGMRLADGGSRQMVEANMRSTGYPEALLHFIEGDVLKTIPQSVPERIALLRLDTDFYDSTLHELRHLYPLVVAGGVIFIDDYGWCEGARQATDSYLESLAFKPLLTRIDETVRVIIKPRLE